MNMYSKNKNSRLQKTLISIAVVVLFVIPLFVFESPVKNIFFYLASPLLQTSWKAGDSTSGFFAPFFSWKNITMQYDAIKQQNEGLLSEVAALQDSLKEYQLVKQAGESTAGENFKLVSAQAIGQDTSSDFILINKGSDSGVGENMPVISSTKVLYGKVVKVYKNFSQVMLVSNKNSVVDVKVEAGAQPVLGAIKGGGGFSVYLDLIPSDADIQEQNNIITSGQEGIFPKNLLMGKVSLVHKNDAKPFQTADVQPFFDIKNMENLFVITNYLKR